MSNQKYMDKKDARFAEYVFQICKEFKPDIIYVCHGTQLRGEVVDRLKREYFLVADLIDRLEFFPALYECIPHYDIVYTYIKADCEYLRKHGVTCKHLPAIGNSDIFKPLKVRKDIDICFVGATYPAKYYGDRLEIIDRLIADFPDKRIFVGGECAPIRRPEKFLKWVFSKKKRSIFNNRNITSEECNVVYNRSRICLNINRINTGEGWSERFGNIMFTGALQLVTYNDGIVENFGNHILTFKSYDELREMIHYYLEHEEERKQKALEGHQYYLERVKEMNHKLNLVDDVLAQAEKRKSNSV